MINADWYQRVTYSIVDQPDGRFDLVVQLGSGSSKARKGFMTLAEAEEEIEFLRVLMTACGAPVVRGAVSGVLS
jgi:hypothetical protein